MKEFKWRKTGASALFCDSMVGSDLFGDGTETNPYKTLRRAWESGIDRPLRIICRGYFSEDMADGNHSCTIEGDYMGSATFDGADTYLIYGFAHKDIFIVNCAPGSNDFTVWTGSGLLAGAGRANLAGRVGAAYGVCGVAGSPVVLDRTGVYYGVLGGTSAVSYCVFSRIRSNSDHRVSIQSLSNDIQNNTFYGVPISERKKRIRKGGKLFNCIFAEFDMFADDYIELEKCLFLADCKWYYNDTEITISGTTSYERENSLIAGMNSAGVPEEDRPVFTNCIFSTQVSTDVFNNPEKVDFTLKLDSDAILAPGVYIGALPPALNVPIMNDSSQKPSTWDERTIAGCIEVSDNAICLDEASTDLQGEILSKIISLNPTEVNINAIFANFATKFTGYYAYLWDSALTCTEYTENDILPIGRYIVKGSIVYDGNNLGDNSICVVSNTDTTFIDSEIGSVLIAIDDPNISNVVYLRETPMPYLKIQASDGLEAGGVYLNIGTEDITYRTRTIVPGESFVAVNSTDTFSGSSGYEIGVMFDDSRVPSPEWIPAQLWGEYFVWRSSGVIQYDNDGVPISSGNYLSYQRLSNGGYSDTLIKSYMRNRYFQLKFKINKYRND